VHKTGLRQYIVKTLGLMISLGFTVVAVAAPQQRLVTVSKSKSKSFYRKIPKASENESGLSGSVSLSYSQSLVDYQDGEKSASGGGLASLSGSLTSNWRLSGSVGFDQNFRDEEDRTNGVSDLSFGLRNKNHELASWLSGAWSLSASYPLSEYSAKVQGFQGSIGTRYSFSLTSEVLAKGWDLYTSLSANRSFHKFETDPSGSILNPYSIRKSIGGGYSFQRWNFSASFSHVHRFNYEGRVSESYQHSQDISFEIQPDAWSMSVGHSNGGSWLKQNDQDSNLQFVDENSSTVYAQTEVSF